MACQFAALAFACATLLCDATQGEPGYVIEAPDVVHIEAATSESQLVDAEKLVGPDGTVSLGAYGNAVVTGLTVEEARSAIAKQLTSRIAPEERLRVRVEVVAPNSKACYIISPEEKGDKVRRYGLPMERKVTVAAAILDFEGLASAATMDGVRIVRPSKEGARLLEVDWGAITGSGLLATNYRLQPGDRIYLGTSPQK